jgi:chromosome segregation ATPase
MNQEQEHGISEPDAPGDFIGDIWFGNPIKRTLGTHRWTGRAWEELATETMALMELLAAARARTEQAEARVKEAADLLADRSTELDNERQARQAAEASVKELEEEIERRAAQEEMDDSLRDGCMDSLLAAESTLKERNEEVERLRAAMQKAVDEIAHLFENRARLTLEVALEPVSLSHQGGKA